MDGIGKSDPFAILYVKGMKDAKWSKLGETKTIPDCLNPDFPEIFLVNYKFERDQILKVEVFDEDEGGDFNNRVRELIGNFECPLNKLLTAHNQTIKGELVMGQAKKMSQRGKIYITGNSVSASNDVAKMNVICHVLDKKNKEKKGFLCFCKPPQDNPFLVIDKKSNIKEDRGKEEWTRVLNTDEMEGNLDPEFRKISINMFHLCQGNKNLPLRFSLYSACPGHSKPILYGHCEISAAQIERQPGKERELLNEKGKPKLAGTIIFSDFAIVEQPSFIDYLKAGWYINLACAIDFTASNAHLHDIDNEGDKKNDYELSILEVGKILKPFCYKQQFSAFGFGGIPHFLFDLPNPVEKKDIDINCFSLGEETTFNDLDVLLSHYRNAVQHSTKWGPTLFSPLFSEMKAIIEDRNKHMIYHCLLILTDGCIHDLRKTVNHIVDCTVHPLSIIIVGIGDADFSAMETLDSDEYSLVDGFGIEAKRDIC